jgi:DNA polymerase III delta prime subunit
MSSLSPRASIEFDGSLLNGVEFVHEHIKSYAMSGCLYAERKILFIDQADLGVKRAQYALLKTVEDSRTSRYIFAANDRAKLIPALRSRLVSICFDVPASDQAEVQMRLMERYRRVFEEMALPYDEDRMRDILRTHYPDLRAIANHLDVEFATPAYAALARDGLGRQAEAPQPWLSASGHETDHPERKQQNEEREPHIANNTHAVFPRRIA